ncbi:hypothetical protein [Nonomuraea sp. KM90]|uniref:hypothetical protein n=1 Tax=Nonomuraea sp. KM90 TaxID=3457428 RepID=UPI003FCEC204
MVGVVLLALMMLVMPEHAGIGVAPAAASSDTPSPTPSTSRPSPSLTFSTSRPSPSPSATTAWDALPQVPCIPAPIILIQCNAQKIGQAGEQLLRDAATEALEQGVIKPLANLVLEAITSLVGVFVAMFLSTTTFDLRSQGALTLYGLTIAIGWLIGAVLLMIQMLRTMVQGRPVALLQAFSGLVITALVGGAGVGLTALLMEAANSLTAIIFNHMSTDGLPANQQSIHQQILTVMSLRQAVPAGAAGAGLQVYVNWQLGVLVILVLIIQLIVVLLRNATLPLLALLLPIAAAGMIGGGATRQWLPKIITAAAAIIVYQPCVALIITAAVRQWSAARDAHGLLYGLMMLVLSLIAMPALLKVFAPLGALAAGSGANGGGTMRALAGLAMMLDRSDSGHDADASGAAQAQPTSAARIAQQREADSTSAADADTTPPAERPTTPATEPAGDNTPPPRTHATDPPTHEQPPAATTDTPSSPTGESPAETPATTAATETASTTTAAESSSTTAATTGAGPIGPIVHAAEHVAEHGTEAVERHVGAAGEAAAGHPVDRHPAPPSDSGEGDLHDRT